MAIAIIFLCIKVMLFNTFKDSFSCLIAHEIIATFFDFFFAH